MPEDNTQNISTAPTTNNNGGMNEINGASNFSTTSAAFNPAAQAAPTVDEPKDSPIVLPGAPVSDAKTTETSKKKIPQDNADIYAELTSKIRASKNILIALSSNPSVDEMAAAIGLSIYFSKLNKRATAIYSGVTPNALEFLKPEETFESTADALQDFVIALNKEKADHLRYKLDGEFVKIYITPYRTRIADSDLEFSYGDFNVDLVLALDVANGVDLDSALREHGRIMHDAVIINISTSKPGKFGEIEWSDKAASSVSEMIAKLLYSIGGDVQIGKEEATAFLTGIVAATNRFANAKTTPETMKVASRLMKSGANQQLVSKNITPDVENEIVSLYSKEEEPVKSGDPTELNIDHDGNRNSANSEKEVDAEIAAKDSTLLDDLKAAEASLAQAGAETIDEPDNEPMKINTDTESIKATEASLAQAGAETIDEPDNEPMKINTDTESIKATEASLAQAGAETIDEPDNEPMKINTDTESINSEPTITNDVENDDSMGFNDSEYIATPGIVITPEATMESESETNVGIGNDEDEDEGILTINGKTLDTNKQQDDNTPEKTSQVTDTQDDVSVEVTSTAHNQDDVSGENTLTDEVQSEQQQNSASEPEEHQTEKIIQPEAGFKPDEEDDFASDKYGHMLEAALDEVDVSALGAGGNPAIANVPNVPGTPEINGIPDINYSAVSGGGVLPPPPAPSIDMTGGVLPTPQVNGATTATLPEVQPIEAAVPPTEPTLTSLGTQPAMQDQVYNPQAADPGAFKIPGVQ